MIEELNLILLSDDIVQRSAHAIQRNKSCYAFWTK